jgi:hypothetical protein
MPAAAPAQPAADILNPKPAAPRQKAAPEPQDE